MADAPLGGYQANLVSWGAGGSQYATMKTRLNFVSAGISVVGETHNSSAPLSTISSHIAGLRSWFVDMEFQAFSTPRMGNVGIVQFSAGGYTKFVEGFVLTLEYPIHDVTAMRESTSDATPVWRTYIPDIGVWSGAYAAKLSDSTAPVVPPAPTDALPTMTLVYGDSATDEAFSGTAILDSMSYIVGRGQVAMANIGFRGVGNPTSAGTSAIWPAGTVGLPSFTDGAASPVGPIVLASKNGSRLFTGYDGFLTRLSISCQVGQPVTVSVRYQGCGSLTVS